MYLILRTSWVCGLGRPCFVTRVLDWARRQPVLRVAADQANNATWCRTMAQATANLLATALADSTRFPQRFGAELPFWLDAVRMAFAE